MELLKVSEVGTDEVVASASRVLNAGGIAVLPTETVYGLACRMDDTAALERLYNIKTRARGKPIAILAAETSLLADAGFCLNESEKALAAKFWPGALTLVLRRGAVDEGVRIPAHVLARKLCAACGGFLRVTSANHSGEPDALDAATAVKAVGQGVDVVIDDGKAPGGVPSTVLKCDDEGFDILREGAISHVLIDQVSVKK